jgi:hypothetical protein
LLPRLLAQSLAQVALPSVAHLQPTAATSVLPADADGGDARKTTDDDAAARHDEGLGPEESPVRETAPKAVNTAPARASAAAEARWASSEAAGQRRANIVAAARAAVANALLAQASPAFAKAQNLSSLGRRAPESASEAKHSGARVTPLPLGGKDELRSGAEPRKARLW